MPDQFLKDSLQTPGTSGAEQSVQNVVRAFAPDIAADVSTDVHGNVLATLNPGGSPTILLDAHCDQIGLIVRHIDSLRVSASQPGWRLGHADSARTTHAGPYGRRPDSRRYREKTDSPAGSRRTEERTKDERSVDRHRIGVRSGNAIDRADR